MGGAVESRDLTRSTGAPYHAPVPVTLLRSSLHKLADVVEQIFRIAFVEDLHPRPEEYDAAACEYQAAHGLSYSPVIGANLPNKYDVVNN
jgi:hypothetical protein